MKSAIIHFEPVFSRWDQSLFTRKAFKNVKSEINVNDKQILIYNIPVWKEKPSEKMMLRFISYLKEEEIDTILLSDSAEALSISHVLKKHFKIFNGSFVINYKLYDILRKCAEAHSLELSESTLVLLTSQPEKAKEFILKIYKHIKRIKIKTEKPEIFSELSSFFLYEYGLFIEVSKQTEKKEFELFIYIDGLLDSANLYLGDAKQTEIIFNGKNLFKEIKKYKKLNQITLEFLIYQFCGKLSHQNIKLFFKTYPVRIIKLIK